MQGSVLHGRDSDPIGAGERCAFVGGFAEGDVFLNDRTLALVRVDAVHQTLPASLNADESTNADAPEGARFRANTVAVTPGLQFLVRPNVELGFEYQVRQARKEDWPIAQLHFAF